MNPDAFMPFYGNEFFQAVEGQPEAVVVAYMRVCWHYWHHEHCKGLKDDSEYLRRLCRAERDDWPAMRDVLFDNDKFMCQDADGRWHQKRAEEIWIETKKKYDAVVNAGKARWKGVSAKTKSANASRSAKIRWQH